MRHESDSPVPDRLPEDLAERYGRRARRVVRYRRSWRYRFAGLARRAGNLARDDEAWVTAVMIFGLMAVGLTLVGGLVYAIVMWPWVGLYVLLPALGLLALSFLVAVRVCRPER